MIRAAVLGKPIAHSRSPLLHNSAYARLDVDGDYSAIEVDESSIASFLRGAETDEFTGFSLTMPLKDILRDESHQRKLSHETGFVFEIDTDARTIGSVNTLLRTHSGFRALSTDYLGFRRLLAKSVGTDAAITVLGGGGTARAAIGALASLGCMEMTVHLRGSINSPHVTVLKHFFPKVEFTFREFGSALSSNDLLLNTTPQGSADTYALDENLDAQSVIFESLYHPWPTALAEASLKLGILTFSGKDLLVEQALDQISLMTGKIFDFDEMREFLLSLG